MKMVKHACRWTIIDTDGCDRVHAHGGGEKQDKKSPKWESRACFVMHGHGQKSNKLAGMVVVTRNHYGVK